MVGDFKVTIHRTMSATIIVDAESKADAEIKGWDYFLNPENINNINYRETDVKLDVKYK